MENEKGNDTIVSLGNTIVFGRWTVLEDAKYLIVDAKALPSVYLRVIEVKRLLAQNKAKNLTDATRQAGISRSVYYKYRDMVNLYERRLEDSMVTCYLSLEDKPGVLAGVLDCLWKTGANILTINQNIPQDSVAPVVIAMRMSDAKISEDTLLTRLTAIDGVLEVKLI